MRCAQNTAASAHVITNYEAVDGAWHGTQTLRRPRSPSCSLTTQRHRLGPKIKPADRLGERSGLVDVAERALDTFVGDEIGRAVEKLAAYDLIASIGVRTLRFDPGSRRLGELGPPQKTRTLNRRGRTLKITTGLLVQGSCGISRPFGDETKMREYLAAGELPKLRRRLEADAKSLYAIYQYGRLHGTVRLRWGFLDERLPAPWVHRDEVKLHNLKAEAYQRRVPLQVVVGSAPTWADPWSRLRLAHVVKEPGGWRSWLVDDTGSEIQEDETQLARLGGVTSPRR